MISFYFIHISLMNHSIRHLGRFLRPYPHVLAALTFSFPVGEVSLQPDPPIIQHSSLLSSTQSLDRGSFTHSALTESECNLITLQATYSEIGVVPYWISNNAIHIAPHILKEYVVRETWGHGIAVIAAPGDPWLEVDCDFPDSMSKDKWVCSMKENGRGRTKSPLSSPS